MSSNKLTVEELNSKTNTTYVVGFPVSLNKDDTPESAIEKIDQAVLKAREEIVKKVFASRGIKVEWSN